MGTRLFLVMFVCLLTEAFSVFSQETSALSANILFYNVENLFNPADNEGKDDGEFQPDGERRWTNFRKQEKLNKIARVILNAGKWNPPVLVGLCEVEDREVLNQLVWDTGLNHLNYFIEHFESPDRRGIDVALLYRKDRFEVLESRPLPVSFDDGSRPTRDILYVKGILDNLDTLHVMINHWPSRWGGEVLTSPKRMKAARVLKEICDSLISNSPLVKIIAMGDFNDTPVDESIRLLSNPPDKSGKTLINLAFEPVGEVPGTIKYQHQWSCFDQILVSPSLCFVESESHLAIKKCAMTIFSPDFLLEEDPDYPGLRPRRTYIGFRYSGGFSDHLPVLAEMGRSY